MHLIFAQLSWAIFNLVFRATRDAYTLTRALPLLLLLVGCYCINDYFHDAGWRKPLAFTQLHYQLPTAFAGTLRP
jgi:hypothetical protein